MSLSRDDHLAIARDKLVLVGLLSNPRIAHDIALLEGILARALQDPIEKINPYVAVGRILRYHRENRLTLPRNVAVERVNRILHKIGDQGLSHGSALARIEYGEQRLTYLQALALADVYGIPYDAMLPPDYDPFLGNRDRTGFVPQREAG